jgi:hypothetical protein
MAKLSDIEPDLVYPKTQNTSKDLTLAKSIVIAASVLAVAEIVSTLLIVVVAPLL